MPSRRTDPTPKASRKSIEEYDLQVCGVKVNSTNCSEIHKYFDLTRDNIQGTAVYDPTTNTLTLAGDFSYIHGEPDCTIDCEIDGIIINIAKDTTLSAADCVIAMRKNGVITGKGTLNKICSPQS